MLEKNMVNPLLCCAKMHIRKDLNMNKISCLTRCYMGQQYASDKIWKTYIWSKVKKLIRYHMK